MQTTERKPAMTYRKNTLEARLDAILPDWESFTVVAHELSHDGMGWSVNDSWKIARDVDRARAIHALRCRFEVFRVNYAKRARANTLEDANWSGPEFLALLEIEGLPFAEVRNANDNA
jgi:hypothetical protein